MEPCVRSEGHDFRVWELDGTFWIKCLSCFRHPSWWVSAMGRIIPRYGIIRLDPSAPKGYLGGFWAIDCHR
jgi:hypothetical protein